MDPMLNEAVLIDQIIKRVSLSQLNSDIAKTMKSTENKIIIKNFINQTESWFLAFMVDTKSQQVIITDNLPEDQFLEMFYFLKKNTIVLDYTKFNQDVIYGSLIGKQINVLLTFMSAVFIPSFHKDTSWPDSIKNEFSSKLQKFMSHLNDEKWKNEMKTILYIPIEVQLTDVETACKNKEMIQRLEMITIHWTRQIKEVLSSQDALQLTESSGPLEEIQFWDSRCEDLSGITMQLDKPGVKKVNSILLTVKSSYVAPFSTLSTLIKESSTQAQSNLKYLMSIKEHCTHLCTLLPKEIPKVLPLILNLIRLIWKHSPYYTSKERVSGLLRKLSNEVINRCSASINLDRTLSGFVSSSKETLFESISCCQAWKDIYNKTQEVHMQFSDFPWDLNPTAIFAQIDAFVQRCKDLVEVCDCQYHFSRMKDGVQMALPVFKGQRGTELLRGYMEIECLFENNLMTLQQVKKAILDVKVMSWLDDYSRFRSGMKDLEVMMQNLINSAFETVVTVEEGVDVLDIFITAIEREGIKRTVEKKVVDIFTMLMAEVNFIKREVSQKSVYLLPWQPTYSGTSGWVKMMKRGLERSVVLLEKSTFLPTVSIEEEVKHAYSQLCHSVDECAMRCYNEWIVELSRVDPYKLHDTTLLKRIADKGFIDINYDEGLMKAFREVAYWEQLSYELPQHISDVLLRRESYRVQRENVLLIVREYNRILSLLSMAERGLFRERIMFLDRKVLPGLTKITWSQNLLAEQFLQECRTNTIKIQHQIDNYKLANIEIVEACVKISEQLLLSINRKRVYEGFEFEMSQKQYCSKAIEMILSKHQTIVKVLLKSYEFFKNDGPEVQQAWLLYLIKIDTLIEDALRTNIKLSFLEITKSIIGDGKAGQTPMFKLDLILTNTDGTATMDFSPSLADLSRMVLGCVDMTLNATAVIERVPNLLTNSVLKEPMNESMEKDPEIIKIKKSISVGMQNGIRSLMQYLYTWDSFKEIWEKDKGEFLESYMLSNPSVEAFDTDIYRYSELSASAQLQESIVIVLFVLVDASILKLSVTSHCQEWQSRLTNMLYKISCHNLNRIFLYIDESKAKMATIPATLEQLENILPTWDLLNGQRFDIEGGFAEVYEQFNVLSKYDAEVDEDVTLQLKDLTKVWSSYCHELEDSEFMLKKIKDKFKHSLLAQSEELKKHISLIVEDFHLKGPFSEVPSVTEAGEVINDFKDQVGVVREQESVIKQGLMLFKLDQQASKEIYRMEQELDQLEEIWELAKQWDAYWIAWKDLSFSAIWTKELDDLSNSIFKKVQKLAKDLKSYNWLIIEHLRKKVELFRSIIPVINKLNNLHLRPRHWDQIQLVVGKSFDHTSKSFTLENIVDMELHAYAEKINEISSSASKEILIEQGLEDISNTWKTIEFDMVLFKDKDTYKIRSIEDIQRGLEDNQIKLATMKSSKYAGPFRDSIDDWETLLSTISETVELLLVIQKSWAYLEQIFMGEDIRKQVPRETLYFDDVNDKWKVLMAQLYKIRNVYQACHFPQLLTLLGSMEGRLEFIMSSLDMYLETKRQLFPRFYFISNNDMLEILGLSKTPIELQFYIRKCFEHIKTLSMSKVGLSQKWEATHMNSSEGESVNFITPVYLDGNAEIWMIEIEKMMKATVKEELKRTKASLRRHMSKKDKWLKENSGQACICASLIQWTSDVTRALVLSKEHGEKNTLKMLKKKIVAMLNKFSEIIRTSVSTLLRNKITSFITMEIHSRDVVERLIKAACADPTSFDWIREFRSYWDRESNDYLVKQTNASFVYSYEYLGNIGRMVITPLTDRSYITLLCALFTHKVGALKGSAGTGKTETVKEVGKALGAYVVLVNCSEKLDYKSMGRFFSGLAQAGAWGCFDEFNRINVEVLSVVAQQILSIFTALTANHQHFIFEGNEIKLNANCGIFTTMSFRGFLSQIGGSFELPDNLKSMFRPIALLVPDTTQIVETVCFVQGLSNPKLLSKKLVALYTLAQQQLTKRSHYSFGIRDIITCVSFAGSLKRENAQAEDEIIVLSIMNSNNSMLSSEDLLIFRDLLFDIFPGVELQNVNYSRFLSGTNSQIHGMGLQADKYTATKVLQVYETYQSRHCNIILGNALSGKSTVLKLVQNTLCHLAKETEAFYEPVKEHILNPKTFSLSELYGEFNHLTSEWSDGIIPRIMRSICSDEKLDEKWVIFDGPVDSMWVESMNSLIDENKILTLINGERIALSDQVRIFFEVSDLSQASAATVTRCGVVFFDYSEAVAQSYATSWINSYLDKGLSEELKKMFEKYVSKLQAYIEVNQCHEPVPVIPFSAIISLCRLFDTLSPKIDMTDTENVAKTVELTFVFSLVWSIGGGMDEDGRKKVDSFIRELEGSVPTKDTIYEYCVDYKLRTWVHWEEKLKVAPKPNPHLPFHKIIIPTIDILRYSFLFERLTANSVPVLLVGPEGYGKSTLVRHFISKLDLSVYSHITLNMYANFSEAKEIQDLLETRLEKRTKEILYPYNSKRLLVFIDDMNMTKVHQLKAQPALELFRLFIDYGFWYERKNFTLKHIRNVTLLGTMAPPGAGRLDVSKRLQSKFNLIYMCAMQETQQKKIFSTMWSMKISDFGEDMKVLSEPLAQVSVAVLKAVAGKLLPTPSRIHYMFNLHEVSKVYSGLMRVDKEVHNSKRMILRLWVHESFRVFHDRLVNDMDREAFVSILNEKLVSVFDTALISICKDNKPPVFCDFLNDNLTYEDKVDVATIKAGIHELIPTYQQTLKNFPWNTILFSDSIEHICRFVRVLRQPKTHLTIIGIGGNGKRNMLQFACLLCGQDLILIDNLDINAVKLELKENLKRVLLEDRRIALLVSKKQLELFLIEFIVMTGEVMKFLDQETINQIFEKTQGVLKAEDTHDQLFHDYMTQKVLENVHVIIGLSPTEFDFRGHIRTYAPFIDITTIDWFCDLSMEGLVEIAHNAFDKIDYVVSMAENDRQNLNRMFAFMHMSMLTMSAKVYEERRTQIYTTRTHYAQLLESFKNLFREKRDEIMVFKLKLKNGLWKIGDTKVKVEILTSEMLEAKKMVDQFQKQCEEYLASIVQQKREADEQAKSVAQKSAKIGEEELKCRKMAEVAQADLAEALPGLEEAKKALEALNKKDISEIKSYGKPPMLVEKVLEAVMILRGNEATWAEAKRQLSDSNFIKQLLNFDADNISDRSLKKISAYCMQSDFQPEIVGRVSLAAKSLCMWVRAIEQYAKIYRVVEPKRHRLAVAESHLNEKRTMLLEAQAKLAEIETKVKDLKMRYESKLTTKEEFKVRTEMMELKLERASQLLEGLAGEKDRWQVTVEYLEEREHLLLGRVVLATGIINYMGLLKTKYRREIVEKIWVPEMRSLEISDVTNFDLVASISDPVVIRSWGQYGLPEDVFSIENGIIATKCHKWPLMIDPHGQANKWIRAMEQENGIKVLDQLKGDFPKAFETALINGSTILLENLSQNIHPNVLDFASKYLNKQENVLRIKFLKKEIEVDNGFKMYLTTKLTKPNFSPVVSFNFSIIDFAAKQEGMENQFLTVILRRERPELEEQKDSLVSNIANGKKKIKELNDDILRLLNEAQGSLLDDEQLLLTLQTSKSISQEVNDSLQVSEATEARIDETREGYRPSAERASILFFALNDMLLVDPMYQFSLDSYLDLFNLSIEKSHRSAKLEERIQFLNDYHTYAVYRFACRGLFEKHKLVFSFNMCIRVLTASGKIQREEYKFFLRGGIVLDRDNQMDNPCSWLPDPCWDNITELDKLTNFHGLIPSFEQYHKEWFNWYVSAEPETTTLPGEWDIACNELQRILIVRSLRQDRGSFCVTSFITNNLGSKFVEPPILSLKNALEESTAKTPLTFILSPGVDPTHDLIALAESKGMLASRFQSLSLGQGQASYAHNIILQGAKEGHWIFLANCHFSISWLPTLDMIIMELQADEIDCHPDFRLWLSCSPTPHFPISILHRGINMTSEPPKGIKANMKRMYTRINDAQFIRNKHPDKYRKLFFCLVFFHSIIVERKKFLTLGWNSAYEFNDADFEISDNFLSMYVDENEEVAWDALKFLIANINYGGHVLDECDKRLMAVYISEVFVEEVLSTNFYKLTSLPAYYVPKDGSLNSYREYISMLPNLDPPELFGQHTNADIISQNEESRALFDTLLMMKSKTVYEAVDNEGKVLEVAEAISKLVPEYIDFTIAEKTLAGEKGPIKNVLKHEVFKYNQLMRQVNKMLEMLIKGIKGVVRMTLELEETFDFILASKVPPAWLTSYPSLKPLFSWVRDLGLRVEQFQVWASTAQPPKIFWLSAFSDPTCFLAAVMQTSSHSLELPMDMLTWEVSVMTTDDSNIASAPKEGVLIRGLYLQGAGWDMKNSCLVEAEPMQLVNNLPTVLFKPVELKRRIQRGVYSCPCYYYPNREGVVGRSSYIVSIDLKSGERSQEHWVKRGVAALMSLDT